MTNNETGYYLYMISSVLGLTKVTWFNGGTQEQARDAAITAKLNYPENEWWIVYNPTNNPSIFAMIERY